jgi:hypothetical protein
VTPCCPAAGVLDAAGNRAVTPHAGRFQQSPPGWAATATWGPASISALPFRQRRRRRHRPVAGRESHTGDVPIVPSRPGSYGGIACRTTKSAVVKAVISGRRMRGCAVS